MLLLRLACLFSIFFLSTALLAAEPVSLFKAKAGETVEQEVINVGDLQLVAGDRLILRSGIYADISTTVYNAYVSEDGNKLFFGEVGEEGAFRLVVSPEGAVLGSVSTGMKSFNLSSLGNVPVIELLDPFQNQLPEEAAPIQGESELLGPVELNVEEAIGNSRAAPPTNLKFPEYSAGETVIDIFFYHDEELFSSYAPSVIIDYLVGYTNDIFDIMGVNTKVRAVGQKQIDIAEDSLDTDVLKDMRERNSPFADIDSYIQSTGADLIHYVRGSDSSGGACGLAHLAVQSGLGSRAYGVGLTAFRTEGCLTNQDRSFTHEVGHNMGTNHNREDASSAPAYYYSYGSRVAGDYRTIMAYGGESTYPLVRTFSWPEVTCYGSVCGTPPNSSDSADNRRSVANTKRLVSGFGGDFKYAAVQEYPYIGSCSSASETFKGAVIRNNLNYDLEAVYLAYLSEDGSLVTGIDLEALEFVVASGTLNGRGFCHAEDDHPVGTTIREAYYVYKNPETGALIEGTHVFFDDNYSGDYAVIRAAAGAGGSVVGNPSLHARVNAETEIAFKPNYGYKLSGVSGTCPGSLHYNVYTAEPVYGDCWAIASFKPLEGVDLIQQHFSNLLQTVMSVRGAQSSSAKADASDAIVSSNSNQALR